MKTNQELPLINALRFGAKLAGWLATSLSLMLALSALGGDAPRLPHQPVPQQAPDDADEFADPNSLSLPTLAAPAPAKASRSKLFTPATAMVPAWTALGPAPIPNGQTDGRVDPVSGRVTAIEIHPTNPNIIYVGTAQGGVYRSLNGGTNWTAIFDDADSLAIGALALAPSSLTTLYVGTGEANGSGDSYAGVGLYRVDNADTTADLVGPINPVRNYIDASMNPQSVPVFTGRSISKIVVHPTQPGTVFVGTAGGVVGMGGSAPLLGTIPPLSLRGLWRSLNADGPLASITFDRIKVSTSSGGFDVPNTGNRNINDIVMDPADASGNSLIVWQTGVSTAGDGGVWRSVNAMAADATTVSFVQTLATTATSTGNGRAVFSHYQEGANPTVIYVASGEPPPSGCSGNAGALRRSIDGGATWSAKLAGGGGFAGGQGFYNLGLAVKRGATTATTDDIVHIGGNIPSASGCARLHALSTDGGATFVNHDMGLHADTHAIASAPSDPNIVFHGNDGGIWKSTDGGLSWRSLNNTQFSAMQFESIALHPTDRNFMIGGTQDNGTEMMNPDGSWIRADYGDGGFALIDQNATDTTTVTMYHTYFNQSGGLIGFARVLNVADAHDGGWSTFGAGLVAEDADDPDSPTEETIANGIGINDSVLFYAPMTLGPGNPNTVYFGTDRLYRSTDRGEHMSVVSQAPLVSGNPISAIGISPQDDNVRIVGLVNGKVFATTNGSSTMTDVTGPIPARFVGRAVIDPNNPNTAYVALCGDRLPAGQHIWKTTTLSAGGGSWVASGTGIPDVPVNALVVDPSDSQRVYAGTDIGVYASEDGGATWSRFGTGFPRVAVFGLALQNNHRILRAATHGRGIYEVAAPGMFVPHAVVTLGSRILSGGNGNGTIDFNECNNLNISLNNVGNGPATGVSATLSSMTAGVTITQPTSAYADIAAAASGANLTPFKIETSPAFVCGTPIDCVLTVDTTSDGMFTFPFQLPSGSGVGSATGFDSADVPKAIPDNTTVNSMNTVLGLSAAVGKVTVSLHLTHTFDGDLVLSLIAPNGTTVILASGRGGSGDNYGTSCSSFTFFDDTAATAIGAGTAPFVGSFRPDQALSAFNGMAPAVANGTWTLRIQDTASGDTGTLQCWSLSIAPASCTDGGGSCSGAAPMITCSRDISTTNDLGQCSASVSFTNTVTGVPTPDVVCTLSNSVITSPHTFAVGTNLVLCTATNVAGTNSCMFTVTVRDAQAPVLAGVPANTTNQCLSSVVLTPAAGVFVASTAAVGVTATDNCGPLPVVRVCTTNGTCPVIITCIWTATDKYANSISATQTITVLDTMPPSLVGVPANTNYQCLGDVPPLPTVTATDNCGPLPVVRTYTTNGTCPLFITCTWTATDSCTNSSFSTRTFTVRDTIPPVITCPSNLVVSVGSGVTSTNVSFAATATDNCAVTSTNCIPPSGSSFPVGTNTVLCTATDACTNSASCSFTITVQPSAAPVDFGCQISYWNFDEPAGNTALDSAGGNPGTLINGPVRVPGRIGSGALQFDGVNDHVNVPHSASLNVPQRFSISLWFRPGQTLNAASGRKDLFKKFLSYWVILNYPANDGRLSFVLNSGGSVVRSTTASWTAGQWYHVAATHDGTTMRLYVNGVLENSLIVGVSASPSTFPVQIGGNTEQGFYFPGAIDDARLFCTNLAASTVLDLFNGTTPPPPPANTPPVISDIASLTIPANNTTGEIPFTISDLETPATNLTLSATSTNTVLAPLASITFGGSGSNRTVRVTPAANQAGTSLITITVSDGALTAFDTFLLTVTNTPVPPPVTGTNQPISRWQFDEAGGVIALDMIDSNPGTLVNSPLRVPGHIGIGALQFNGVNQYVNVPDSNSLDLSNRFSIAFWFRPSQLLNAGSGRRDLLQKFLSYWVILNYPANDGKIAFVLNSGNPIAKSTTTVWNDSQWYHVAATYDGVTMRLYINGVLEGAAPSVFLPANTANPLQIGGNTTQGHWFPGAMDDVRLYGNPLSAPAITDVMNGLSPLLPPGGLATTSPTIAITIESENDLVVLKWSAQAGRSYRVEYTDDLATGDWTPLPGDVTVSGTTARTEDTLGLSTQRFYRVVIEP